MRSSLICMALCFCFHGCSGDDDPSTPGTPRAIFVIAPDAEGSFFDLPWPTDLRRTASGHIDLSLFPNPSFTPLVSAYKDRITDSIQGYGTNSAAYLRVSEDLDPGSLPADGQASLESDSSVFLLDLERLERHPVRVNYQQEATVFWPSRTLGVQPVLGLPLRPATQYALVATTRLLTANGIPLGRDRDFTSILAEEAGAFAEPARLLYRPAIDAIETSGVPRDDLISLAVFTTQDPTAELSAIRDWMVEEYPAPTTRSSEWRWSRNEDAFSLMHGVFGPSPQFQEGEVPFAETGGVISFEGGVPILQGEFDVRFSLTVPRDPPPDEGYPIVLYAHGTGGDWLSFVRNDVAARLGELGIATLGVDQIHHGDRNPTTRAPEGLFFNIPNPDAVRDNVRQSAIDLVQLARLVENLEVPSSILAGAPFGFDTDRIYFYGHSQGGINGPLFLAVDDHAQAGVLSGTGAVLGVAIVEKTEPVDIPALAAYLLRLPGGDVEREGLRFDHPVVTLLQTWLEVADTANYADALFANPRPGFAPKSILHTMGTSDGATPPSSSGAFAAAARIPLIGEELFPIEGVTLQGHGPSEAPVQGNVAGGEATAGLVQFTGGHFVAFRSEDGEPLVQDFFRSLLEGTPRIPALAEP